MTEYIILNLLVFLIYMAYLNKKTRYKIAIVTTILWVIIVGSISIYQHNEIEQILNKDIFGNFTLIVHLIFGIMVGLFNETLIYQINNSIKYKFIHIIINIIIILTYVLLSFKIDFFLKNY